jgi:N-acetylmuramoyl-L-alanine amidase/AmpD protein
MIEAPSPNHDSRPDGCVVDTIVLHATVLDSADEVVAHFSNPGSRVASHYTIDRDGTVYRHVQEERRAWHAGQSRMPDGREGVNDFSIGIELVNRNDGLDPYPETQLSALMALIRQIRSRQPIRYIVTHAEIAMPPGRKTDPQGLDMDQVRQELDLR